MLGVLLIEIEGVTDGVTLGVTDGVLLILILGVIDIGGVILGVIDGVALIEIEGVLLGVILGVTLGVTLGVLLILILGVVLGVTLGVLLTLILGVGDGGGHRFIAVHSLQFTYPKLPSHVTVAVGSIELFTKKHSPVVDITVKPINASDINIPSFLLLQQL
jgi:hypothetical protein